MNGTAVADLKSDPAMEAPTQTQYAVAAPGSDKVVEFAAKRIAIFVAHGMGQQIPFETLDAIAESLRKHDSKLTGRKDKPTSNTIKAGPEQWLQRIELKLKSIDSPVEAHVYEGYWAPLTEGRITLRQLMSFLGGAGNNGLKIALKGFWRWLMKTYEPFPTPIRIVLYLLIALATVASLVVLNSTIVTVAATRTIFSEAPWWLTKGLFADLTTTFNVVTTTMIVFAAFLGASHYFRKWKLPVPVRKAWSWFTLVPFYLTVLAIILAGVFVACLLFIHIRGGVAPDAELWQRFAPTNWIARFNATFDSWALVLVLIVAAAKLRSGLFAIRNGFVRDLREPDGRGRTIAVAAAFLVLVVAVALVAIRFFDTLEGGSGIMTANHGIAWPMLVAASALIRLLLVQYLGDVAIYVMPYKVDAFNDLRKEIKEAVYKVAHAVYALKDESTRELAYDQVIVLGHSLGSVIVYDALNRLIHEDGAAEPPDKLHVVDRTPLFLTFGSPLDKTAFIFGAQGHGTTEAREALAASVQPLIQGYEYRPESWINIYSPWDILGGKLDLYDLPKATDRRKVNNIEDPEATTLLMAHTEYWNDSLLVRTLYGAI